MAEEHTVKISNELVQMCREGLLIACVLMKQYQECMIPEAPLIVKNPGDQEAVLQCIPQLCQDCQEALRAALPGLGGELKTSLGHLLPCNSSI